MKRIEAKLLLVGVMLGALLGSPARGARAQEVPLVPPMSFGDAIRTAGDASPQAQISGFADEAAKSRVKSAKAQRLPKLSVNANVLRWNDKIEVSIGPPPAPGQPAPKLLARDLVTSTVGVTLAQPLTALIALSRLVKIEESASGGARQEAAQAKLDAAQRGAEAYLRLLQAKALAKVAAQSLTQVEAQLKTAQTFEQAGALSKVDVLRLQSARETARQNVLKADANVTIAQSVLGLALNLPLGQPVDAVDDLPEKPAPAVYDETPAVNQAMEARPEVALAHTREVQADGAKAIAKATLLPNLLAVANYTNLQGQGPFQPKNSWYVGLTLNWDVWDWGKNINDVRAAESAKKQAAVGKTLVRDQIAVDVRRRLIETKTAYSTLDVAALALNASEEANRIQNVRFKEGAATTTEVIDAESEVSRARNGYAQARYDYFLAQASLARSIGQVPAVTPGGTQ